MMMVTAVVQIMVVLTEAILQMIHLIIQMGLITIIQAIPHNNSGSNSSNTNSTNTGSSSSSTGNSDGMKSTDLPDILGNQGFTREYSNVYIYTENDTYYGEIIIQPEVSIIYIKQRSGGFDSKINSVLSELLPSEYSQVWSNYLSASSDRTFTAEGRKVRIVTAAGGGHSQIVIYN